MSYNETLFKTNNISGYDAELRVKTSVTENLLVMINNDKDDFTIIHLDRKQQLDLARALING
jgi:hypothetical protein